MSHCDSRVHRRAAKMKDLARASVSGASPYRSSKSVQQSRSRTRRAKLESITHFPTGLACSGTDDCDCMFCEYDDTASIVLKDFEHACWRTRARDHNQPGYRMAEKKLFEFDGEFDPWFSWLKHNMPDTLAGRHLLDHIVGWVWCGCINDAKHNYKGCICKQQSAWSHGAPGDYWMPRPDEPNVHEAFEKLLEFNGDERWDQWLDSLFLGGPSSQARQAQLRNRLWCERSKLMNQHCGCRVHFLQFFVTYHKAIDALNEFLDTADAAGCDTAKLVDEVKKWMNILGVEEVKPHSSGGYLVDVDDSNFVHIYRTHLECIQQFDGARYEPAGVLRWRVDFIGS
jgi:hypothetical protein